MSNEAITRCHRRAVARPAWWVIAVLVAASPMLVAACGSSGSTSTGTSSARRASAAAGGSATASGKVNCANVNSLRRSLESLSHTSVSPSSAGMLAADLKNIQTQAVALKGQGHGKFSGVSSELTASVNQIQKAAGELATNPTAGKTQLTAALTALKSNIPPVMKELNAACPKPTA